MCTFLPRREMPGLMGSGATKMRCSACKADYDESLPQCPNCRTPREKPRDSGMMVCPQCGASVKARNLEGHLRRVHANVGTVSAGTVIPVDIVRERLEQFLADVTIRSLYRSAKKTERRRLLPQTAGKFRRYRRALARLLDDPNVQIERDLREKASQVLATIQGAFVTGLFAKYKGPRQRPYGDSGLVIYSGGLPGLGKRS